MSCFFLLFFYIAFVSGLPFSILRSDKKEVNKMNLVGAIAILVLLLVSAQQAHGAFCAPFDNNVQSPVTTVDPSTWSDAQIELAGTGGLPKIFSFNFCTGKLNTPAGWGACASPRGSSNHGTSMLPLLCATFFALK
jgi:hypothetical protein